MSLFTKKSPQSAILFYDQAPKSAFANQIRGLRTYLQQNHPEVQALQISSARDSEGKSVIAANLALAYAKTGQKTLLVDTNFGYPAIKQAFELQKPNNLIDAINSSSNPQPSPTPFSKLDVIATNQTDAAVSDILANPRLVQLIDHWRQNYEMIIFDSSSLAANPNAQIIATLAYATLLTVRAGKTKKTDLNKAMATLSQAQANVVGTVAVE